MNESIPPLLDVKNLQVRFDTYEGSVRAVDGVDFRFNAGEVLGIGGESGCGKSVTALSVMGLGPRPPGRIAGGEINFKGTDLLTLPARRMREIRGNRISMIFQEPMTSLSPVFTVGEQIAEVYRRHRGMSRKAAAAESVAVLRRTRMPAAESVVTRYPHELSGGMRQRVMIAMALACNPEILIADEATTALDVTIQAQILDLMLALKDDFGASIMLITHDLGVVAHTADRVVVMYVGRVVESAPTREILQSPLHPYTQGLIRSIPGIGVRKPNQAVRFSEIQGVVPSLTRLPAGCKFADRCPEVMEICRREEPVLETVKTTDGGAPHDSRCWLTAEKRPE